MEKKRTFKLALSLTAACLMPVAVSAQEADKSAPPAASQLPDVKVIQKKPVPVASKPKTVVTKKAPTPQPVPQAQPVVTGTEGAQGSGVYGRSVVTSPLAGSEMPIAKIPGAVSVVTSEQIAKFANPNTTDALQQYVPGVIITDLQGNSFNQDIIYHGFVSSPVNGVPQGLAVYQNGVRINEVYSDVVEWDTIPSIAIDSMAVISNNPAFGLNAVGGALSLTMKNGFTYQGTEINVGGGSFGRYQGSLQYGAKSGNWGTYVALEGLHEDGWRDFSESTIRRMYADLGVKGDGSEFHLSFNGAKNFMGLAGSTGIEAIQERYENVFTTPQTTDNELAMVSATGSVKASDTLTFSGTTYFRSFKQKHADGNLTDLVACDPGGGFCFDEEDDATNIPGTFDDNAFYGSIDRTSADAKSEGASVQAVEKAKIFGLGNNFLVGTSFDHGSVETTASSEFGFIPSNYVVQGTGLTIVDADGNIKPVNLDITTDYFGVYLSDAVDLTDRLTVTAGGRYNYARIALEDLTGTSPDLTGTHTYERFNPEIGATYKLLPGLSVYGGYSESNRAPTPAELACADPEKPCLIESFLVADPDLKQVVGRTVQAGIRGESARVAGGSVNWEVGFFHTGTEDEILNVEQNQRGFFVNAGKATRQGIDVAVDYKTSWFSTYMNYSFTDAVADSSYTLFSAANPNRTLASGADEDDPGTISVSPGDRLPLIPRHNLKVGFDMNFTPKWKFGADAVVTSDRIFQGDESNLNTPLPGYQVVNLHTSYDLTDNIQIYGLVNNVFDQKYYLFGTYFNPDDNKNRPDDTDHRSVMPGAPLAAYGGVKFKF